MPVRLCWYKKLVILNLKQFFFLSLATFVSDSKTTQFEKIFFPVPVYTEIMKTLWLV